jgi:hypothetical protein
MIKALLPLLIVFAMCGLAFTAADSIPSAVPQTFSPSTARSIGGETLTYDATNTIWKADTAAIPRINVYLRRKMTPDEYKRWQKDAVLFSHGHVTYWVLHDTAFRQ